MERQEQVNLSVSILDSQKIKRNDPWVLLQTMIVKPNNNQEGLVSKDKEREAVKGLTVYFDLQNWPFRDQIPTLS